MMYAVAALLMSLVAVPQEPAQDDLAKKLEELTRRVEALEKEKVRLMEQVTTLERFGEEAAETISRLKKMVQNGATRPAEKVEPAGVADAPKSAVPGPLSPVHGKVLSVVPEAGFMIINLGSDDGVKEGWTFEVIRTVKDEKGNPQNDLLGKAVFEKYVESRPNGQSKLKIVEGDPEKMKYGDSIVANRRLEPLAAKDPAAAPAPVLAAAGAPRKFRVVGVTGDTYFVNAGSKDKLKQSDKVFIYRDKRAIAQLRLDQVGPDFAAGKIIDGTKLAEPAQDDDVQLKDLKTSIVGKVKRIEPTGAATGAWIEVGKVQGVKTGMQFEVRRKGKLIGRLVVKDGGPHHSVCDAVAPMTLEELTMDDFVESVE